MEKEQKVERKSAVSKEKSRLSYSIRSRGFVGSYEVVTLRERGFWGNGCLTQLLVDTNGNPVAVLNSSASAGPGIAMVQGASFVGGMYLFAEHLRPNKVNSDNNNSGNSGGGTTTVNNNNSAASEGGAGGTANATGGSAVGGSATATGGSATGGTATSDATGGNVNSVNNNTAQGRVRGTPPGLIDNPGHGGTRGGNGNGNGNNP